MNTLDSGITLHTHRALANVAPAIVIDPPEWTLAAVCASTDPEIFFPEKGGSIKAAKQVCASCPVRVDCLRYALTLEERFGVYGGLSERERRRLIRSGWRDGDPVPDVITTRPMQPCQLCHGQEYRSLAQHMLRAHGHLRGAA